MRRRRPLPRDVRRIALDRVDILFSHAEKAALMGNIDYASRYVQLAMKIAKKAATPIPRRYHGLYCRKCGTFMMPGVTSHVRIHRGRIIRKCLVCGSIRRVPLNVSRDVPKSRQIDAHR